MMHPNVLEYHISKVYELLFLTTLFCGMGMFVNYYYQSVALAFGGMIGIFTMIFIMACADKHKLNENRHGYTLPFGFLMGLTLSPLVSIANLQDETIVPIAGLATCVLFLGFTFISKFIKSELHALGFALFACLNALALFGIMNLIFGFGEVFEYAYLGSGLIVFSLLVAYDTEDMKQRFRNGDINYVTATINLFLDVANLFVKFVRLLMMLKKSKSSASRR